MTIFFRFGFLGKMLPMIQQILGKFQGSKSGGGGVGGGKGGSLADLLASFG